MAAHIASKVHMKGAKEGCTLLDALHSIALATNFTMQLNVAWNCMMRDSACHVWHQQRGRPHAEISLLLKIAEGAASVRRRQSRRSALPLRLSSFSPKVVL